MSRKITVLKVLPVVMTLVAVIALTACGGGPDTEQASQGGGAEMSAEQRQPAGADEAILDAMPDPAGVDGWNMVGEARTFGPDNLWEYINGGAEGYLVYNFEVVATADWETPDGVQAVLDVYRMADRRCGFGIYAAERPYSAEFTDELGTEGYVTENAVHFWKGPYYVKVTAFDTGHADELKVLARATESVLDAEAGLPPAVEAFPAEGLVPHSRRYHARDVLGHSELKNGFTADYALDDGTEFKAFFILHDTTEQAGESFRIYREFMEKYGKDVQIDTGGELPLFTAEDSYYGHVVTVHSGNVVVGLLGLKDPGLINEYLSRISRNLADQGLV